jgi:cell division protein FtsL
MDQSDYNEVANPMQTRIREEILKFNTILITLYTAISSATVFLPFQVEEDSINKQYYGIFLLLSLLILSISITIHFSYIQHVKKTLSNFNKSVSNDQIKDDDEYILLPGTLWMKYISIIRQIQILLIIVSMLFGGFLGVGAL